MSDTPNPPPFENGGSGNETTFGSIEPIEIQEEMERSFLEYSMSVIISRALPDVRDGLKPVHRRILWDMETQNFRPDRPFVKCARVSGDCFVEGALVRTPEGLKPIEQFVEGDVVLDALGKPTTVVTVIENPASEITRVEFEAGWSIDVTAGQLFRVLNEDYSLGWVRADKVDGQRVLMAEAAPEPANIDALADRKAYVAGLLVAEGWLHSRGKPTSRTVAIGMTDPDPLSMVAEYLRATGIKAGLSKRVKEGTKDLDVIRFTADDDLLEAVATTSAGKQVPRFVLADRSLFGHFIAGFLDGDGHIRTDGTRAIAFVSTSAMLLRQLRSMLGDLGVAASLYRKPTQPAWADCWHLMVSGSAATMLAQALGGYLAIPRKAGQLAHLAEFDGRTLRHAADSFPAAAVYEEVTRLHRGGGWFEALDGTKFRQALRTGGNRNAKVRFSVDRSTGLLTRQNLIEGGVLSLLHAAGSPLADRIRHALRFKTLAVREVRQAVRIAPTYDIQVDSDEHEIVVEGLVVHNCVAKFHPHGDGAVYDALVRMAQPFSLRHPLIDFHGNFGSPDFGPAASRYTECRLSPLAMQLLDSIDENTVDMVPNYDGSIEEPKVLPARFPNLLVNGSQGIAVGMATNIPPHNLGEVIDATLHLIDNPDATPDDLMQFVKGPDFPTGGYILGRVGITDAYRTGRGSVKMRAVAEIEETAKGGLQIVVRELPYQTSVNSIASRIKQLADSKDLDGIRDINDESAGIDTRLVISLKRDANANVILNNLYKLTPMQTSFGVNIVALVDGVPRQLNLRDCLHHYVVHQVEVITRRSQFRRDKAASRAHIVEGLVKALNVIDEVIALIRASEDREGARQGLIATFGFSDEQAEHILSMQLSRLTRLARIDLDAELTELQTTIAALDLILADEGVKRSVVKEELVAIRDKYATPRLAKLTHDPGDMSTEDLIDDKELVVTMTEAGYIKTVEASVFRTQSRGGRGKSGGSLKQDDLIRHIVYTSAHAYLLCFSNRGKVYRMKAHEVPERDRTAKGIPIVNLLPLQPGEKIQTIIDTRRYDGEQFLFFTTRKGTVKKTDFTAYDSSRRDGLIAINLHDGDELVKVIVTSGADDVFMVSLRGMTIRFNEDDVRSMGRTAAGVRGMKLRSGDEVVSCDVAKDDTAILMVTENGYGKRTEVERFTRQGRGGQGVIGIKLTGKKGQVVAAFMVGPDDEIIGISSGGTTMRTPVRDISSQGRDATGVRIMNLDAGQVVASVAPILANDEEDVE